MDWAEIFERVKQAELEEIELGINKLIIADGKQLLEKDPKDLDNEKGASV